MTGARARAHTHTHTHTHTHQVEKVPSGMFRRLCLYYSEGKLCPRDVTDEFRAKEVLEFQ